MLEMLPIYAGYARMISQARWQSDTIAGWIHAGDPQSAQVQITNSDRAVQRRG